MIGLTQVFAWGAEVRIRSFWELSDLRTRPSVAGLNQRKTREIDAIGSGGNRLGASLQEKQVVASTDNHFRPPATNILESG